MKRFLVSMFAMLGIVACSKDNLEPVEPPEPEPVAPGSYVPYVDPSPVNVPSGIELDSTFYSTLNIGLESYFDDFVCDANGLPISFDDLAKQSQENLQKYFGTYIEVLSKGYLKDAGIIGDIVSGWLFGSSATNPLFALLGKMSEQLSTIISKLDEIIVISQKTYETLHEIEANEIYDAYNALDRRVRTMGDHNNTYYGKLMDIQDTDTLVRKKKQTEIINEWANVYIDGKQAYLNALDVLRAVYGFNRTWDGQKLNHLAIFDKFTLGAACWENCTWNFRDAYRARIMYEGMRSAYLLLAYYDVLYTSKNPATKAPLQELNTQINTYVRFVANSKYTRTDNAVCLLPGNRFILSRYNTFFKAINYSCDNPYIGEMIIGTMDERDVPATGSISLNVLYPFYNYKNGNHSDEYQKLIGFKYRLDDRWVTMFLYRDWEDRYQANFIKNYIIPGPTIKAIIYYYAGEDPDKPVSLRKMLSDGGITFDDSYLASCLITSDSYVRYLPHDESYLKERRNQYSIRMGYYVGSKAFDEPWDPSMKTKNGWPRPAAFNTYWDQDCKVFSTEASPQGLISKAFTPKDMYLRSQSADAKEMWEGVLLINKGSLLKGFEAYGTKY